MPDQPWQKLTMDYFNIEAKQYLLICDCFSKVSYVYPVTGTFLYSLKDHMIELFSIEDYLDEAMDHHLTESSSSFFSPAKDQAFDKLINCFI